MAGSGGAVLAQRKAAAEQAARQAATDDNNSPTSYTDANGVVVGGYDAPAPGVRSSNSNKAPDGAPQKATAAPTTKTAYTGLCAFLNANEQKMVGKDVEIANHYSVVFNPTSLAASKIKLPGGIDKSDTSMPVPTTAKEATDPQTNQVDTNAFSKSVTQGTQIIQFIELVMRNSSYITDQQTQIRDQVTGNAKASMSSAKDTTTWFKINVNAVPIGTSIDKLRQDYAYDITYIVTPYAINQAESQYFPKARFRGCHKVYDYWFTGNNTQVLHFEQEYNNMYFNVIDGKAVDNFGQNSALAKDLAAGQLGLAQWPYSRVPTTASGQSSQGAKNDANNPASTLADYLYSADDQASIKLKIIGDPAWIQQGEVVGLNPFNINFNGFYSDGTINTDVQQAVFAVNWNAPDDYNLNTGLMEVNKAANGGSNNNLLTTQPRQSAAYVATKLRSNFSQGKFEQELEGTLLTNLNAQQLQSAADLGRPKSSTNNTLSPGSRQATLDANGNVTQESELDASKWPDESGAGAISSDSNTEITNPPTQPALPAAAPTSNGEISDADITYQATLAASVRAGDITAEQAQLIGYKPQQMAHRDD